MDSSGYYQGIFNQSLIQSDLTPIISNLPDGILAVNSGNLVTGQTTTNLPEGSNLYYTDARARNAINGGAGISYSSTSGTITNTGVITISGTTNQVIASGTNAVTLSLPQSIATFSQPTFARLTDCTIGSFSQIYGTSAGQNFTGSFSTIIGYQSVFNTSASSSLVAVGFQSLYNCTSSHNVAIGATSGYSLTTGANNVFIGSGTGRGANPLTTGSNNCYIGTNACSSASNANAEIVIGNGVGNGSSTATIYTNKLYISMLPSGVLKSVSGLISNTATTSDLPEGSNLYYTDARARNAINGGIGISYSLTTGIITNTGVIAISGTADQVIVSGSGTVTLSLPQSIATNSSVQFARLLNSSLSLYNVIIGNNTAPSFTGTKSVIIGDGAMSVASSCSQSTALGNSALAVCTGSTNTAVGAQAGSSVTTGNSNVIIGCNAGVGSTPLTTGTFNVLLGPNANTSSASSTKEIVIGQGVGAGSNSAKIYADNGLSVSNLTSGVLKSVSGVIVQAGFSDYISSITGTPYQIIVTGTGAITLSTPQNIDTSAQVQFARILNSSLGSTNLLLGNTTGNNLTSGGGNTLIGQDSGNCITTGSFNIGLGPGSYGGSGAMTRLNAYNVAIGVNSMYSATGIANNNVAIGYNSLQSITTGDTNVSIGSLAGKSLTSGGTNIFIGYNAGAYVTIGSNNIALGNISLGGVTTGSTNIAIGYNTLTGLTTGVNNLHIGTNTQSSSVNSSGAIVINTQNTTAVDRGDNTCYICAPSGLFSFMPAYYFGIFSGVSGGNFTLTSLQARSLSSTSNVIYITLAGWYEITLSGTIITTGLPNAVYHYINGTLYPYSGINNCYMSTVIGYQQISYNCLVYVNTSSTTNFTYYTVNTPLINTSAPTFVTIKYISC